jgi:hypothetical protein
MRALGAGFQVGALALALLAPAAFAQAAPDEAALKTFTELLKHYREYPELQKDAEFVKLFGCPCDFPASDGRIVRRLTRPVLEARFKKYNVTYRTQVRAFDQYQKRMNELETALNDVPLSDSARRARMEIQLQQAKGSLKVFPRVLFAMSVEANIDLQNALTTLKPDQRVVVDDPKPPPKLPGVYGGSIYERQRMKELEKLNLTPVDPEFYATQLGRKLEKDLGGRAEFWSYNYDTDELYVKVGAELAKLNVTQDTSGVRFLRTRVGAQFMEPIGSDEKVDLNAAQGKFLTGDENQESLWGKRPAGGPAILDETGKPVHKEGDGHNHDH